MDYFILRNEKTGEIIKLGRFGDELLQESFRNGEWIWDEVLDRQLFDGLLEEIPEAKAKEIIAFQMEREKIAA